MQSTDSTRVHFDLTGFVTEIYDAALDSSRWMGVLEKTASFVGGSAASFFIRDFVNKNGDSTYHFGTEYYYKQLYFEKYFLLDPMSTAYMFLNVGEVVSSSNIVPFDEFVETRFYKEWAQPQGIVDNVLTLLDKSTTSVAGFVVFRNEPDGLADEPARERMRLIVPHVRRAALISKAIDLKTTEAEKLTETLDGVAAGMFLVDAQGRLVHANTAGRALLASGDLLRSAGGRIAANERAVDLALRDSFALAGEGDRAIGVKGIAVPLTGSDGERYVAHVLPLTSGRRGRAGAAFGVVAAIFVRKAALDIPSPPEVIAKAYGLTPSELRALLAVVQVGGVPEVAEALGVAETTVKTHLSRIFKKTGTNRQADLVKLVASYTNPLST
jgi:DNA-binding CsgD family transcriptional regulator